jgi:TPP-dependent pyruvate/acetoin dehydrogenase alpha subunit
MSDERMTSSEPPPQQHQEMLANLVLVREFELACERLWTAGEHLVGEFHLSLGQEAFAVAACAAARADDPICPSIRGMGVYLCRGVPMVRLIASFLERQGGISEGRWAHWHTGVPECAILPQTGMLGSGLNTAVGVAMANKLKKSSQVVVAMLGDGSTNTGYFHEGVNLAAVRRLPIVIVIENNQIAVSTPIRSAALVEDLSTRAAGYGIPGITVDGTDVVASYKVLRDAIARARHGEGPTLVELKAFRWGGQTLKDADRVRATDEKANARKHCPIERLSRALVSAGTIRKEALEMMARQARERISKAESEARSLPALVPPPAASILDAFQTYA